MTDHERPALCYVTTHFPRVAQTFIFTEVEELRRLGHRVESIAMNRPGEADLGTEAARDAEKRTFYLKAQIPTILKHVLRFAASHPGAFLRMAGRALASSRGDVPVGIRRLVHMVYGITADAYCVEKKVRHLHAHDSKEPAAICWFASMVATARGDASRSWSFTVHGPRDFIDESVARLDLKVPDSDLVVAITDFTKSQICSVVDPAAWDRITIVRCGIDLEAFPLRPSKPSSAVPRILIVGRLVPEKGHIILVRALARLRDESVPLAVDIIGTGPFEAAIRAEARRLGVEDRVLFVGQVHSREVSQRLREADIFCLPSFAEGLPIAIMEAMAVGVPVVTTYIAGIPELAVDRRTAMVVPAGNVDLLAAALRDLVSEPGLRDRLVAQARQAVEDRHVLSRSVASLAASFENAVRSRAAS